MANATYALTSLNTNVFPNRSGMIVITATLSATAYSSGITLDVSSALAQVNGVGTNQMSGANTEYRLSSYAISWGEVYGAIGVANITTNSGGGNTNGVCQVVKTTTSGQFTVNIFLSTTGAHVAAGNLTGTIQLFIITGPGANAYNT